MDRAYEQKLFDSCRVLFGADVDVSWDFLLYLQPSGIKTAFRRMALLTHPDRVPQQESGAAGGADLFIRSKDACDRLLDFISRRHQLRPPGTVRAPRRAARRHPPPHHPPPARESSPRKRGPRSYYYRGALPRRRLLLGEFLFYRGAVSWESLIRAIVWQRRQRPRLGDIASKRGWISEEEAGVLSRTKGLGVPMGEALVRAGLLSRVQVQMLLWRQQRMQAALGGYFVSEGLLTRQRLEGLVEELGRHNSAYPCAGRP